MNNTKDSFVDAELRPDVDRDRLLTQIAQGLLTAHARLDLMEERLVQATSRAVVEQLTSAVSTIKTNGQISSAQLTELKEVLRILANARQDFSSAATQAIDKQIDCIHAAQNEALKKLSTNQQELQNIISKRAEKSDTLLNSWSKEHTTNLTSVQEALETSTTDAQKSLSAEITQTKKAVKEDVSRMSSTLYTILSDANTDRDTANSRFKQQVTLIMLCFLSVMSVLLANRNLSTSDYNTVAISVSATVIGYALYLLGRKENAILKQTPDDAPKDSKKQKEVF